MRTKPLLIYTNKGEMREGLFGQIALFVLEILPYLYARDIYPAWDIRSDIYGDPLDGTVIPGAFDLAYIKPAHPSTEVNLCRLLGVHAQVLGNDWHYVHHLWNAYFRVPERVVSQADAFACLDGALGIHYRGTDKNTSIRNPVTHDDMIAFMKDWVDRHPDLRSIFVATDEDGFVRRTENEFPALPVYSAGSVCCHKDEAQSRAKADRAVLDCLLLSRCRVVLKCSSALSGFARILNPDLEIYRVAACEQYADIPYFPDAFIPVYETDNQSCRAILKRTMQFDWLYGKQASRFAGSMKVVSRYPLITRWRRELQFRLRGQWIRTRHSA